MFVATDFFRCRPSVIPVFWLSRPLFFTIIIFLTVVYGFFSHSASAADEQPFPAYIDLSGKPGSSRHLGEANVFFPLAQDHNDLFFLNLRGQIDNKNNREFNVGLGARHMFENYIVGGYGFFDVRNSDNNNLFYQSTVGGEFLSKRFDLRANGYIPFTKERPLPVQNVKVVNQPNLLQIQYSDRERALYGFDGEIGLGLQSFLPGKNSADDADLRLYLGGYHFFGKKGTPNVSGPRGRLELSLFENDWSKYIPTGTQLILGLEAQHDKPRGGQVFGLFRLRIPLHKAPRQRLTGLQRRMTDPVVRDVDIVTVKAVTSEPALFADTEEKVSGVETVSDAAGLYKATTGGQANKIVVVNNDISTSLENSLQPGQALMPSGMKIALKTPSGIKINYTLPGGGNGRRRTITQTETGPESAPVSVVSTSRVAGISTVSTRPDGTTIANAPFFILDPSARSWTANANNQDVGAVHALTPDGGAVTYSIDDIKCQALQNGVLVDVRNCNSLSIDRNTGVIRTTAAPSYVTMAMVTAETAGGISTRMPVMILSDAARAAGPAVTQPGGALANREESHGVTLLYGNDFNCSADAGRHGQNACAPVQGNTKIDAVKRILQALLRHDNANNDGAIQAALRRNLATLTLFNTPGDKKNNEPLLSIANSQDLQASETFADAHNNNGRDRAGNERNAALEEITHLIHNYGITHARPDLQLRLNEITRQALAGGLLTYTDANQDGFMDNPGNLPLGDNLPRSDLDDEYFADGVEAYFNLRGAGGYTRSATLCSSGGLRGAVACPAGRSSRDDLRTHHRPLYNLIEEIFGSRQTLF